ncbi:hypothetical protein EUGRSUZ_E01904 [Eucalyptus grandis]|uniref:Uncharacterized protein n=2 Tax=Eucalyptus grandis TaxID=71139 RepID=A0ACC3KVG2_EUCGR|nr:hypothetical protein EUGRSUZ_E01904 [Eucalyptus grandis]
MAVEARRAAPFPARMIVNRFFGNSIATRKYCCAIRSYPTHAEDFIPLPSTETETPDPISRPSRRRLKFRVVPEFSTAKSSVKSDSGSTSDYNAAVSVPRSHHKRSRDDAIGDDHLNGDGFPASRNPPHKMRKASPFLRHEVGFEIQGRESEIDCLISQHTQAFARKLKEKDREIQRIGKLNGLLQEKLKILAMESQMWRGLAQDNEFEADSLRSTLQRVLSRGGGGVDDAESCCGSNGPGTAAAEGGDAEAESTRRQPRRRCGRCGKWEVGAVLLPRSTCACARRRAGPATATELRAARLSRRECS